MPTFGRSLTVTLFVALALAGTGTTPGAAHTAGQCAVDVTVDRCEAWAQTYDDAEIRPPDRSDQFVADVAATGSTVFLAVKDVALNPDDPYAATGSWAVVAYDAESGDLRWESRRASRVYDFPTDVAVAPDGRRLYVTGAAYNAFSVSATDSRMVTVAYDTATGAEVWSSTWDNRPDGTDNGKVVTVSPDGREVYVGGITTTAQGDLDYLTVAYDSRRGRQLWEATYAGTPEGSDALFAVGAAPDGSRVYVTGWSDGAVPYDADYATVAYRTGRHRPGSVAWVARYDGVAANRSDRANALAVAADGSVLVTGDSYAPGTEGGTRYDAATVRYAGDSGTELWAARFSGPRNGLDSGVALATSAQRLVVSAQAVGADEDSGHDTVTIAYDLDTGAQLWLHREDAARSSEHPSEVALAPDGATAYVLSSAAPVVPYTALDELLLHAYRMSDGTTQWTTRLDAGPGNALAGRAMTVLPDGRVAVAGQVTRSQSPLGPPSQNRYDALTALYL